MPFIYYVLLLIGKSLVLDYYEHYFYKQSYRYFWVHTLVHRFEIYIWDCFCSTLELVDVHHNESIKEALQRGCCTDTFSNSSAEMFELIDILTNTYFPYFYLIVVMLSTFS